VEQALGRLTQAEAIDEARRCQAVERAEADRHPAFGEVLFPAHRGRGYHALLLHELM